MTRALNLDDIQGNVTRAYGRYSYPRARYFFLHVAEPAAGRRFVDRVRGKVVTAARWAEGEKPPVTLNIGFSFLGLLRLGLPTRTLKGLPDEARIRAHDQYVAHPGQVQRLGELSARETRNPLSRGDSACRDRPPRDGDAGRDRPDQDDGRR